MCEPTTLAIIGLGLTAVGGYQQYQAGRANADYQEQLGERNAEIGRRQAAQERDIGNIDEERHLRKVRQMLGAQRAAGAANGLDINSGSALDLQAETAGFGAADASTIRSNALRRAWGLEVGAVNDLNAGRADAAASRNAATGTLITTGASLVGQFGQARSNGLFSRPRSGSASGAGAAAVGVGRGVYGFGG
jgi:hypothetical protein